LSNILYDLRGEPKDWVSVGGKPATIWPDGLPSFEHDDGTVVLGLLVVQQGGDGQARLYPNWYGTACVLAPDGLVPVCHSEHARWEYRPLIYRLHMEGYWEAQGSQIELAWRRGLSDLMHWMYAGREDGEPEPGLATSEAVDRADRLLLRHLNAQQRIELASTGKFRVRGASGKLYEIERGNGFALVSPWTGAKWVSFCLHPEEWVPHDDVMLATKLLLEDEELEQECIGNATATKLPIGRAATVEEVTAEKMERRLIA
jgi:hypothetical protein